MSFHVTPHCKKSHGFSLMWGFRGLLCETERQWLSTALHLSNFHLSILSYVSEAKSGNVWAGYGIFRMDVFPGGNRYLRPNHCRTAQYRALLLSPVGSKVALCLVHSRQRWPWGRICVPLPLPSPSRLLSELSSHNTFLPKRSHKTHLMATLSFLLDTSCLMLVQLGGCLNTVLTF